MPERPLASMSRRQDEPGALQPRAFMSPRPRVRASRSSLWRTLESAWCGLPAGRGLLAPARRGHWRPAGGGPWRGFGPCMHAIGASRRNSEAGDLSAGSRIAVRPRFVRAEIMTDGRPGLLSLPFSGGRYACAPCAAQPSARSATMPACLGSTRRNGPGPQRQQHSASRVADECRPVQ